MHLKVKFDDFVKVIEEDGMIPDVDRQMLGMKTDNPPQQSSVADIMSKNYRSDIAPENIPCLLYTSPSPRDRQKSRMPSSA